MDHMFFNQACALNFVVWLTFQDLYDFCCINEKIYPELVHQFYANLSMTNSSMANIGFATQVNGVSFSMTKQELCELFGWNAGNGHYVDYYLFYEHSLTSKEEIFKELFQSHAPLKEYHSSGLPF